MLHACSILLQVAIGKEYQMVREGKPGNVANPIVEYIGTQFFIGALPRPGQSVRFHGTHFCSAQSILTEGAKAVVCKRKGGEHEIFGRVLFTTGNIDSASRWS